MRIVWGAGIALKNNWILIKKYYNPEVIVDTNPDKWDSTEPYTGLPCLSPDYLMEHGDKEVLITVGDPYVVKDIMKRLRGMNIERIMALTDVLDEWGEKENLPRHLDFLAEEQKLVLFNTPEHDNIGDHLLAVSTLNLLKKIFPSNGIYEVSDIEYLWYKKHIHEKISQKDIILIAGGGFLGSLWLYNGELNVREIVEEYGNNRIVIFPQTIFFEDNTRGKMVYKESCDIYRKHNNLTICARDYSSKLIGEQILNRNDSVRLLPDLALFYDMAESFQSSHKKNVALVCLRNDKESILGQAAREDIYKELVKLHYEIREISMHSEEIFRKESRDSIVKAKIKEISEAQIIVTDTLHCMISAALAGTACIAFDNLSGKVSGVFEWIKDLEYIKVCKSIDEFKWVLKELPRNNNIYRLNDRQRYVEMIKQMIIGE